MFPLVTELRAEVLVLTVTNGSLTGRSPLDLEEQPLVLTCLCCPHPPCSLTVEQLVFEVNVEVLGHDIVVEVLHEAVRTLHVKLQRAVEGMFPRSKRHALDPRKLLAILLGKLLCVDIDTHRPVGMRQHWAPPLFLIIT